MSSSEASERTRSRHARKASSARPGAAGFTLIEVLAAVALLGILYSVLAKVAIEGLRAEGESERRLEASLLADERVSELVGAPIPPVGHSETVEGDFSFALDVTPFPLPPEWSSAEPGDATPLLLTAGPDGGMQALRSWQLTISWLEGANERHVTRTTYLLDFQSLAAIAAATGPGPNAPNGGGTPTPDPNQDPDLDLDEPPEPETP